MCAQHKSESHGYDNKNMKMVALSILVMGLSLAAVFILWLWFGYIGPSFSEDVLAEQQKSLRKQYGLPPAEIMEDPEVLQTPPSLRGLQESGGSSQSQSQSQS